jgi:Ala-tRNA(Pro) deacylase
MQIPAYLAAHQVSFETIIHPPAYTAQKRAKYMHLPGSTVAKSVLIRGPQGFLLAVLPATRHVDTTSLSRLLDGPVALATDDEITHVFLDCEWGVVSPFGGLYGLPMLLEDSLKPDDMLVFEGHTHAEAIRMTCRDFEALEHPRRLRFAR